ncbi:hypothetical protein QSI_3426 [Clostridioides difficile P28]|nr:hypothetical protein QSI_3426 [Clostridioides difficile P28]
MVSIYTINQYCNVCKTLIAKPKKKIKGSRILTASFYNTIC